MFQNQLSNNQTKKNILLSKGKKFDKVEEKMNHIQASLSSSSLTKVDPTHAHNENTNIDDRMVVRLKKELEEKEMLTQK